ncbi:response regulator [Acidobacteriia bacterium AH_259_A11_L15]|nr:response regulator [Acidobacteriia bacterium AH_259_A11_L15]
MGKRILIAEDEEQLARLLEIRLRANGYETATASDGEDALQQIAAQPPDLVLLDVMMPKADGFEVLRSLRETGSTVPVILLTARSQESAVVQGLQLGANDYITKPFSPVELLTRIAKWVK